MRETVAAPSTPMEVRVKNSRRDLNMCSPVGTNPAVKMLSRGGVWRQSVVLSPLRGSVALHHLTHGFAVCCILPPLCGHSGLTSTNAVAGRGHDICASGQGADLARCRFRRVFC